jgi:YebC/PmpR family DNA-binding regulatory protein
MSEQHFQTALQSPALALAHVFQFLGYVLDINFLEPARPQQLGISHGPLKEIQIVELPGRHEHIVTPPPKRPRFRFPVPPPFWYLQCYNVFVIEVAMSGHSKWATIKHKKAATDAKRGRIFTRLIKEISIAARAGGGDADANPRLRTAIAAAKAASMPADNIKRAILRGTGQLEGSQIEEVTFEGYGPGGVAVLVEVATDNRNRTVSEIRHAFSKYGGNLGEPGCASRMFTKNSLIVVPKEKASEDQLMEIALSAGADDLRDEGENWSVLSPPEAHEAVLAAIKDAGLEPTVAEVTMIPQSQIHLDGKQAHAMLKMNEALEEHDDVQNVYANFDIDDEVLEAAS